MKEMRARLWLKELPIAIKQRLKRLPLNISKNQVYDRQTSRVLQQLAHPGSNCIDVGTHRGEILDLFLKFAPGGQHFGFEPLPSFYQQLLRKYGAAPNCHIFDLALSNHSSTSDFNYVVSNPAYSGLKKRSYDRKNEKDTSIQVQTALLDQVIPPSLPIHFIKIDVEGGELDVLKGGVGILSRYHPFVFFECGLGGSDIYGTTPEAVFDFFSGLGYQVTLLKTFLQKKPGLNRQEFCDQFHQRKNYFFLATWNTSKISTWVPGQTTTD